MRFAERTIQCPLNRSELLEQLAITATACLKWKSFCLRTVSDGPRTAVKQIDIRGHHDAHRCCGRSLTDSALVRFGVRYCARPASISKRAPSSASARAPKPPRATARCLAAAAKPRRRTTARTSLRFRINELRAARHQMIARRQRLPDVCRSY